MAKRSRSRRSRHIPQRTCVACRGVRPKRELVRIVRTPDGDVVVDEVGKRNGRGAYVCRQQVCWELAFSKRQLALALKVTLTGDVEARLRAYMAGLPLTATSVSLEGEEAAEGAC